MKAALWMGLRRALGLAAALTLCGCFIGWKGGPRASEEVEQAGSLMSLEGSVWELESPRFGASESLPPSNPITIEFIRANSADSGQFRGFSGCNTYFGTFEVVGEQIRFGPVGVTRMACAGAQMKMEAEFLGALSDAAGYRFAGGGLEILLKGDSGVLRFEKKTGLVVQ